MIHKYWVGHTHTVRQDANKVTRGPVCFKGGGLYVRIGTTADAHFFALLLVLVLFSVKTVDLAQTSAGT